jgi:hypothetical protein
MRARRLVLPAAFAIIAAVFLLTRVPVAGQSNTAAPKATAAGAYKAPRTADGHPDFSGIWANNSATPIERLPEFKGRALLTDEEVARLQRKAREIFSTGADAAFGDDFFKAALADDKDKAADRGSRSFDQVTGNYSAVWLVEREFDRRTSLITDPPDGRMPPMTPAAQKAFSPDLAATLTGRADGPEDRPLSERCITFGIPDTLAGYNSYYQFVQSKSVVAIQTERIHDTRLIRMDGTPHVAKNVKLWLGDSRGRWEGDTLVVDTTNFARGAGGFGLTLADENLHLTERFTRVSPTRINYEFTIDDPTVWTKPWTAMIPLSQSKDQIYEYACHEGNYALPGVLGGARVKEKGAKTSTTSSKQ